MIPIFNELEYARKMNNGDSETRSQEDKRRYSYQELLVYTKWLRWSLFISEKDDTIKEQKVLNGITSFCNQLQLHFNQETDYYIIENLIKDSKKYKLRDCKPISITKNEWNKILEIPDDNARKLYFAFLVIGKYNRENPVKMTKERSYNYKDKRLKIKIPIEELYKYAKIKFPRGCKNNNINLYYSPLVSLKRMGLIEIPDINYIKIKGPCYILNFFELENIKKEDVYLEIYNYENLDEYYRYGMKDSKYNICVDCKTAFKKISKDSKRCFRCEAKYNKNNSIEYSHCVNCGARIKIIKTTQTNLCKKCYNEKRSEDILNHIKDKRLEIKTHMIQNKKYCVNCNKEISLRSKSGRCKECYKEYRRVQKTKTMYELRHKELINNNIKNKESDNNVN